MLIKQFIAFGPLSYVLLWIPPKSDSETNLVMRSLFGSDPKDRIVWSEESEAGTRRRSIKGILLSESQIWTTAAQSS